MPQYIEPNYAGKLIQAGNQLLQHTLTLRYQREQFEREMAFRERALDIQSRPSAPTDQVGWFNPLTKQIVYVPKGQNPGGEFLQIKDLPKDKEPKTPTTAMAAILKQKPDATPDEIVAFSQRLKTESGKTLERFKEEEMYKADLRLRNKKTLDSLKGPGPVKPETLRKEFTQQSKTFVAVRDAYKRVLASAEDPSAAGDLALIFNYMKILDPESVVREGEFATAQNAGSVPERIRASYNKVLQGERLADTQRSDFVDRTKRLFKEQTDSQKQLISEYTRISKNRGVDPGNVIVDYLIGINDLDESNPPPVNLLNKNGKPTEFENGQIWVLRDKKTKRIK